jgi:hypothetical protein
MKALILRIFWFLTMIMIPALTLMGPGPAQAQATYWQVGAGDWFNPSNWDNGVPTSGQQAFVENGASCVTARKTVG